MRKGHWTAAVALLSAFAALAADGRFEKTIPFPRHREAALDWTFEKCTIRSLQVRNYPDAEDIDDARRNDPGDKSWLFWEFRIDNRGPRDCKVRVFLEILDKAGKVIESGDRSGTVDAGQIDDAIRVSTFMRTLDAADAPRVRVRAEILPK